MECGHYNIEGRVEQAQLRLKSLAQLADSVIFLASSNCYSLTSQTIHETSAERVTAVSKSYRVLLWRLAPGGGTSRTSMPTRVLVH